MSDQPDTQPATLQSEKAPPKKVPKKKPEVKSKGEIQTRSRAKTSIFEGKNKKENSGPTKIKVEGIGGNRFSNLLSMFDKTKQEDSNPNQPQKNAPGKLDMNRFSVTKPEEGQQEKKPEVISRGMSIQERMANLMKEGEKTNTKGSKINIDPVLEMNREPDDYEEEEEGDDLALSENEEDNLCLDDDKEENEEKKEEEVLIEDNVKEDELGEEPEQPKNEEDALGEDKETTNVKEESLEDNKANEVKKEKSQNEDIQNEEINKEEILLEKETNTAEEHLEEAPQA